MDNSHKVCIVLFMVTASNLSLFRGIPLSEAAGLLPHKNGRKIHVITIKRWIIQGCRGIRLAGRRIGNEWFTTPEDLVQFQVDCTNAALSAPPPNRTVNARHAQASVVRDRLRQNGFYRRNTKDSTNGTDVSATAQEISAV